MIYMFRKILLLMSGVMLFTAAACGQNVSNNASSVISADTGSNVSSSLETASSTSSAEISSDWYSDILSQSVKNEFKNTAEAINASYDNNSFRYIMITDTHIDTTQSQDNYELVLNTIDYAKRIAANCGIDAIVLGGDFITGWRDKQSALIGLKAIGDAADNSPVPVIIAKGNHDNNINPDTRNNPDEQVTDAEFYNLTQAVVKKDYFIYDDEVEGGLYFYVDFPERRTRLICLDAERYSDAASQTRWLAEKALDIKDEGWKYVVVTHIPIDIRYEAEDTTLTAGSDDIKLIMTALNNGSVAKCSTGNYDFSGYRSKIVSCSFGHTHATYMEYNADLGVFCTSTGSGGAVGRGTFDYVTEDSEGNNNRQGLDNSDSTRYLFDIFSVNTEKMNRIRFGNGVDKTIFSKAE